MTVNVLYTVWCNGQRKDGSPCGNWICGDTAWEARDEARALGWTCGKNVNSRDLCPEHVNGGSTPIPTDATRSNADTEQRGETP